MRSKAKQAIAVLMGGLSDEDAVKQHNEAARRSVLVPCPHCGATDDNLWKVYSVAPRGTGKPELLRDLDHRRCETCSKAWWVLCSPENKFEAVRVWFKKPSVNTLYYATPGKFEEDKQYQMREADPEYAGQYYPARGR